MKVGVLPARGGFLFKTVSRSHVDLASHDGFHPCFRRGLVELNGPVEVAVIGQGQRRLIQFLGPGNEFRNTTRPVQKGVFGMAVQMDKRLRHREINLIPGITFASQNPFFSAFFGKNSQKLVR